jgi:hypothetical protein
MNGNRWQTGCCVNLDQTVGNPNKTSRKSYQSPQNSRTTLSVLYLPSSVVLDQHIYIIGQAEWDISDLIT